MEVACEKRAEAFCIKEDGRTMLLPELWKRRRNFVKVKASDGMAAAAEKTTH